MKDGRRSICKSCQKKQKAIYQKEHREELRQKRKTYFLGHKDEVRNRNYKRTYGITLTEYKELYRKQEGKCAVCGQFHELLHVDHDHKTNKVRGLLCNGCNAGLGQLKEDIRIIEKLKEYILRYV